jgi:hypothetical protein
MQGGGSTQSAGAAESGGGTESATRIAPLYGSDRAYSTKKVGRRMRRRGTPGRQRVSTMKSVSIPVSEPRP